MLNNVKKIMAIALGIASLFIIFLPTKAKAATINVPGDFATIQEGIDAAQCGDVVLVAPGTYFENPIFGMINAPTIKAGITVRSSGGPGVTIINGGGSGHVVVIRANYTTLDGFTVTNSGSGFYGGVIVTSQGSSAVVSARIVNNIFEGLNAGQAVWIGLAPITYVHNNIIRNNNFPLVLTGAIVGYADIRNNIIYNNSGFGSGISGKGVIINNVIDGHYIGIFTTQTASLSATIKNNLITNSIDYGVYVDIFTNWPITSDKVYVEYNDNYGSGIADYFACDNEVITTCGIFPPVPGTGELSVDPLYVNPGAGDYSLQGGSLAIDAGDPAPAFNDVDTSRNDMGAFGGNYSLPIFSCSSLLIPTVGEWGYVILGLSLLSLLTYMNARKRGMGKWRE